MTAAGADDAPADAGFDVGFNGVDAANAAADLNRQLREAAGDGGHGVGVHRLAFEGTVQVDQVQPAAAGVHPAGGHFNRVGTEDGGIFHAALQQAYALAVFQINGGDDQHLGSLECAQGWPFQRTKFSSRVRPAGKLFSG